MSPAPTHTDTTQQKRPAGLPLRMRRIVVIRAIFAKRNSVSEPDRYGVPSCQRGIGEGGIWPRRIAAVPEIPCRLQMGGRGYRATCTPRDHRPTGNAFPMYRSRSGRRRRELRNTSYGMAEPRPFGPRKRRNCRPTTTLSQGSVPKGPLLSRVRIRGSLRQPPLATSRLGETLSMAPTQFSAPDEQSARNPRKTATFWLSKTRFTAVVRRVCCKIRHGISGTGHGT